MTNVIYIKKRHAPARLNNSGLSSALCEKFSMWLKYAKKGERYCYHKGPYVTGNPIAPIAYRAFERDVVNLFQKRCGIEFEYWAQKR